MTGLRPSCGVGPSFLILLLDAPYVLVTPFGAALGRDAAASAAAAMSSGPGTSRDAAAVPGVTLLACDVVASSLSGGD